MSVDDILNGAFMEDDDELDVGLHHDLQVIFSGLMYIFELTGKFIRGF